MLVEMNLQEGKPKRETQWPTRGYSAWRKGWMSILPTLTCLILSWLLSDESLRKTLGNTVVVGFGTIILATPAATFLALIWSRSEGPVARWTERISVLLIFTPFYAILAGWDAGFGRLGWQTLSSGNLAQPFLSGWKAVIWVHAVHAIPWMSWIIAAEMRALDRSAEELAILQVSPWKVAASVTIPLAWNGIASAAILCLALVAGEMTATNIYLVPTVSEDVYNRFALGDQVATFGPRLIPVACFFASIVFATVGLLQKRTQVYQRKSAILFRPSQHFGTTVLLPIALVSLLSLVPLGNLLVKAGIVVTPNQMGELTRAWSFSKCANVIANVPTKFSRELQATALIAMTTGVACAILATILGWGASQSNRRGWVTRLLAASLIVTPGPVIGILLIGVLNRPVSLLVWLYDETLFAPILAAVLRTIPIAVLILWQGFASIPRHVMEVAELSGAGYWRKLISIAAPMRFRTIVAVGLLSAALAASDIAATILVLPPGVSTVAHRVFGLVHAGVEEQVAGLSLWMMLFGAAVAGMVSWIGQRPRA